MARLDKVRFTLGLLRRGFRVRHVLIRELHGAIARAELAEGRLVLGTGSYGTPTVLVYPGDAGHVVRVGSYCSIADRVTFFVGGNHHTEWVSTFPFRVRYGLPGYHEDGHPASAGPIVVGNDVWIAYGATVLSGVTIGDGAVVAAGSVVTRDVAPYAIVAGNPARQVRTRFPEDRIRALLDIRWWDWPEEEVVSIAALLNDDDVEALIAYAERRT